MAVLDIQGNNNFIIQYFYENSNTNGRYGKRMRPHTLTTPKPLIPIAGKPIVERIVNILIESIDANIDEIAFVIGDFTDDVKQQIKDLGQKLGINTTIYHQNNPLGTAHAVLCAEPSLKDEVIIAFADTLFFTKINLKILMLMVSYGLMKLLIHLNME